MKLRPFIAETMWDIKHDPWGSCLGALGPILDVLYVRHGEIPASVGYAPALAMFGGISECDLVFNEVTGENDFASTLLQALDVDNHPGVFVEDMEPLTIEHLEYAARVLDRYADLVRAAGQDY
jgi:hypothetical protein